MSNFTTLDLNVSEAKGLPAKDLLGRSDPYCLIKVDNHTIARTATVWNSLEPFWGEEYSFSISSHLLQTLSIYVYDENIHSEDNLIGKVSLSRKDMLSMNTSTGECWYSLVEVDSASEVHGALHLSILPTACDEGMAISVKILEARNLGMKQKYVSDPYVRVSIRDKNDSSLITRRKSSGGHTKEQNRTSVRKTSCPVWNSSFELISTSVEDKFIFAEVYDKEKIGQNSLIGVVFVSLKSLVIGEQLDRWFPLRPKEIPKMRYDFKRKDLGKVRLNVQLFEEQILPWECYILLVNLLVDTVKSRPYGDVTILTLLEQVMTADRTAIGRALVKLYLSQGMIVNLLDALTQWEVNNTDTLNTLFRGNSLATKAVDEFMKVIGIPYLLNTLKPIIDKIYEDKKYCEIDPNKIDRKYCRRRSIFQMDDSDIQQKSILYLKTYLLSIMNAILDSADRCPLVMSEVFRNLYNAAAERFIENEVQQLKVEAALPGEWEPGTFLLHGGKYFAISSFLFLRFFVPAVLSPKLFGLADNHPDQTISRTLTLLAKVLQSIGNFSPGIVKEPWMLPFSDFIRQYALKLKTFIDQLVNTPLSNNVCQAEEQSNPQTPLLIKEGQLKKYKMAGKLSNAQWKKYNFSLFNDSIHYSKKYDSQTRKFLVASRISAVEKVEDSVFGKSNVFQIILDNATEDGCKDIHYLMAKFPRYSNSKLKLRYQGEWEPGTFLLHDVKEMTQWLSAIRRILPGRSSKETIKKYHRGLFNGQFWNCCKNPSKSDAGCSLTHTIASLNDWQDPVFPEQQAQIIYKQFLLGRGKLKETLVESIKEQNHLTNISLDDDVITKLCHLERNSFSDPRMNSDSGCDTDVEDDKHFIFDVQLGASSRTILNILSIVNELEQNHLEHSLDNCELQRETVESEDEVFLSPASSANTFFEIDENELDSTDTSVSQ